MSAKQIISAQNATDHYINFMEAEYYRNVHNYTHLPSFAAHNADALNKDGCFSPSESHIFHTTGVREPDIRRRSWLDAAFSKINIQTKRKYFTRKIKTYFAAAHAKYFDMLAEYQASVCKTTITDTQPLEASPTRSTQRLDINNPVDSITVPLDLRPYSPAANAANVPSSTKDLNSTSPTQQHMAVVDGGASGHYFKLSDISLIRDVKMSPICDRIDVAVADGKILRSTHHGYLDVPGHRPMMAYVFPELKGSLLSVASFVDVGLELTYSSNFVTAFDLNGNMIFQGDRDTRTGLWKVDLQVFNNSSKTHQAANLITRLDSVTDFVNFWHGAFGSPALSTFIPAVERGFIRIPGLTPAKIRRHPPNPLATAYGHLDATRKGFRSTKSRQPPAGNNSDSEDDFQTNKLSDKTNKSGCMFYRTEQISTGGSSSGRVHADAAGAFPVRAHSGALYQIIYYHEDSNIIHIETTKSRSGPELLAALQRAIKFFTDHGAKPLRIVRMDNEISAPMETWLDDSVIELELTPVAQHRTNRAERAIRTWKGHFIATLAGIDPECPLALWEDFIEQAELTLNIMRSSPINPMISAWEALCGKFDIAATPIAPLGMKVLVHDTPEKRGSWHAHGSQGYYTGRALKHYRCHTVWMKDSRATRISDCLSWHPVLLKMPGSSLLEELTSAIVGIKILLAKIEEIPALAHSNQPLDDADAQLVNDLRSIRELFRPPVNNYDPPAGPPGFPPLGVQTPTSTGTVLPMPPTITVLPMPPTITVLPMPPAPAQRVVTPQTQPSSTIVLACAPTSLSGCPHDSDLSTTTTRCCQKKFKEYQKTK